MKEIYLICNVSKQSHHQALQRIRRELEKQEIYIRLMEQTREIHPGMGLRTMFDMLQPDGIGRDAFIALGLQQGFRLKALDKKTRTTYSVKSNRYRNLLGEKKFTDVNQVWSSDITYVYCLEKFYYLSLIMDIYSRRIIGYHLADNMRAENNFNALKMALKLRGIMDYDQKLIHHSDKGSQYVSDIYTQTLDEYGISISMCNEVYENTHIERVNDTIKNQYLNRLEIKNERDLTTKAGQVIEIYNTQRPHQSLSGMTPAFYENYIQNIPTKNRKILEVYTVKKDDEQKNKNQLEILFS